MNYKLTILLIEDDPVITNIISTILTGNDYRVLQSGTGKSALGMIASHCPDLILLDLGLPDIDGLELLRRLREWSGVPVIVVSARDQEEEKVRALDLGADDYITKPFGTSELLARIRTAIRHSVKMKTGEELPEQEFCTGDLKIDFEKRIVTVSGQDVHLTQIEYRIVELLARFAGKVLTHDYIMNQIWGPFSLGDNRILRVNMANIRRKIEQNPAEPRYIMTEVGVGYRMAEEA